jgi:hypothetical protein
MIIGDAEEHWKADGPRVLVDRIGVEVIYAASMQSPKQRETRADSSGIVEDAASMRRQSPVQASRCNKIGTAQPINVGKNIAGFGEKRLREDLTVCPHTKFGRAGILLNRSHGVAKSSAHDKNDHAGKLEQFVSTHKRSGKTGSSTDVPSA